MTHLQIQFPIFIMIKYDNIQGFKKCDVNNKAKRR